MRCSAGDYPNASSIWRHDPPADSETRFADIQGFLALTFAVFAPLGGADAELIERIQTGIESARPGW